MDELLLGLIFTVVIIGIGAFTFVFLDRHSEEAQKVLQLHRLYCENQGGVMLDRTYQMGKYTNHSYTCVRKDIIIEVP